MSKSRCLIVAIAAVFPLVTAAQESSADWQYSLTPYLWLPVIDGTLAYQLPPGSGGGSGGGTDVRVGPTDWLDLLNYGLLLSGSARKGRFSLQSDLVVLSMTSKNDGRVVAVDGPAGRLPIDATTNIDTRSDMDGVTVSLNAGYAAIENEQGTLNLFIGARYFGVDVESSWDLATEITGPNNTILLPRQGSVGADKDIWDGIVGVRGQLALNDRWSMPYYVDVGTGSSDLTWNVVVAASRQFGWGEFVIAYRHLEYDQEAGSLLEDFSFSGLALGPRFSF